MSRNALFVGAFAGLIGLGAAPALAAPPSAADFGRLPQVQDAAISADGHTLALLGGTAEHRIISIAPIDGAHATSVDIGKAEVRSVNWAGDDVLLVRSSTLLKFTNAEAGGKFAYHLDRDFVLDRQGKVKGYLLKHAGSSDYATQLPILRVIDAPAPTAIVQGLEGSRDIHFVEDTRLPGKNGPTFVPALFRVDLTSLSATLMETGTGATDGWEVDAAGAARVRVDNDDKSYRILARAADGDPWKVLVDEPDKDKRPALLGYADGAIYLAREGAGGQVQVTRRSIADGAESDVGAPFRGEVGLIRDRYTLEPLALCMAWDRPDCRWLDAKLGALHDKLARALPGRLVTLYDWSQDRKAFIVRTQAPDAPPSWFLLDAAHGQLSPISDSYPELKGVALGKVSWFTYKARDGLEVPAYLTLPPGAEAATRLPLIVLPHGGPAARDDYGFDWWAQFLASRGYAVLQPQFRGSGGFGGAFERAGRKEWAGKMQTDLLDGVADLAAKGIIDPSRVCIVGASYGGYAALAGAAFHPEAYRCAVSVNGVSDLGIFIGEKEKDYGADSDSVSYWRSLLGGVNTDPALIDASSPARHADNVRAPVLIISSAEDTTVAPEQSAFMVHALQEAGKPVQAVTLQGDDHYLSSSVSRIDMLQAIEVFLAKNLPVN